MAAEMQSSFLLLRKREVDTSAWADVTVLGDRVLEITLMACVLRAVSKPTSLFLPSP